MSDIYILQKQTSTKNKVGEFEKMKKITLLLFLIILITSGFLLLKEVKAGLTDNVSGWAWSENIGWISFNCYNDYDGVLEMHCGFPGLGEPYEVNVDLSTGDFSGYAWSENIGWISFDRDKTSDPLADPFQVGPGAIAKLDLLDGTVCGEANQVCGWARALSACEDNLWDNINQRCTGSGAGDTAGGWDGWINFKSSVSIANTITPPIGSNVGKYTSIAIGNDGYPVISHVNTNSYLKITKCDSDDCLLNNTSASTWWRAWDINVQATSIAVPADGNPVIPYFSLTYAKLTVLKCIDPGCVNDVFPAPQFGDWHGQYSSVAIDSDGFPIISHHDVTVPDVGLLVTKCGNSGCSPTLSTTTLVDAGDPVGQYTSIAVCEGPTCTDNYPVISYYDAINYDLKVAKYSPGAGTGCTDQNWTCNIIDSTGDVGKYTSIAVCEGPACTDNYPVISYYDATNTALKVAKCGDDECTQANATITTVDNSGIVGEYSSIAFGTDGLPVISYYDTTNSALKVAKQASIPGTGNCTDSNWDCTIVDDDGSVGKYTSIAVCEGPACTDNYPVISYYDATNTALKVAKCATADCIVPPPQEYGVTFNPVTGEFEGWAWGGDPDGDLGEAVIGWMSFNCLNRGVCSATTGEGGPSGYKVFLVNQAPEVSNPLYLGGEYCPPLAPSSGTGIVSFEWTYDDFEGQNQAGYNLQISTDPTFLDPNAFVVNYNGTQTVFPGETGSASVWVRSSLITLGDISDLEIEYRGALPYSWRVKVYDEGLKWSDWVVGTDFTTPDNAHPWPNITCNDQDDCLAVPISEEEVVVLKDNSDIYGSFTSREWTLPPEPDATVVDPDPAPVPLDVSPIEVVFLQSPNPYDITLDVTTNDTYTCSTTEQINIRFPLPEWKEIAPISWLTRPNFVFQNLEGLKKFWASLSGFFQV